MIEQSQLMALKNIGSTATRPQALYVPDQFATVRATALGSTTVWNPDTSNFLLLGFTITVAGTLAAPGEQIVELLDTGNEVTIAQFSTFLPATAVGNTFFGQDYGGGYGYLGADTGNPTTLSVNLSVAMATGHVCVNAWGSWGVLPTP